MVLEKQIQAYVEKHHLVEMKNPHNRYRVWKSTLDKYLFFA